MFALFNKRSRSVANKTLVFGMFKIYSKIYNWFANELLLVLKEFSKLDISTFYSDYYKAYDRLANYRMKHYKNKFKPYKQH